MNASQQRAALHAAQYLRLGRETLAIEAAALQALHDRLGSTPNFAQAVQLMLDCTAVTAAQMPAAAGGRGRVIVTGMGKSGHIGRKIAATLASTGTPAYFVHPAEASHGDLGMITAHDVVLAISNSGESEELTNILPVLKRQDIALIGMTGKSASALGRYADVWLDSSVAQEACPLNLAPTASTTVQLALGDALAVALLDARGFRAEDFARSHPGGALGRKLLTRVADIMRKGDQVPSVGTGADFSTVMREMSAKGLGATAVVSAELPQHGGASPIVGIFTDGDLRRLIEAGHDLRGQTAAGLLVLKAAQNPPRTVSAELLAAEAAQLMEDWRVNCVLATDENGTLVGALNTHDLMRAKVI